MNRFIFGSLMLLATFCATARSDESVNESLSKIVSWSKTDLSESSPLPPADWAAMNEALRALPEGAAGRLRAADVARELLHIEKTDKVSKSHLTGVAWTLLVASSVLREGMTPEQLVAIVGAPSHTDDHGDLVWTTNDGGPGPRLKLTLDKSGRSLAVMSYFSGP